MCLPGGLHYAEVAEVVMTSPDTANTGEVCELVLSTMPTRLSRSEIDLLELAIASMLVYHRLIGKKLCTIRDMARDADVPAHVILARVGSFVEQLALHDPLDTSCSTIFSRGRNATDDDLLDPEVRPIYSSPASPVYTVSESDSIEMIEDVTDDNIDFPQD